MRQWARRFWTDTGRAARPAVVATVLLATLSAIVFVALVVAIRVSTGVSVGTAIFGPGPGSGIFWVCFAAPAILLQGLVAQALRQHVGWLRVVGATGAVLIAAVSAAFVVAVGVDVATWLTTGVVADVGDLVGEIAAAPVGAAFAGLNARAAWLGVRDLGRHRREPLGHR